MDSPTLALARELIRRPSITPEDAGCQAMLGERLSAAGFSVEHLPYDDVHNLWAVAGDDGPLLCFLGHTDVVPPGPLESWSSDPFSPEIRDGKLYGRGAADMKGSVAAMVTAAERYLADDDAPGGRLALLLTSDEEGPSVNGTRRVMETLGERGIDIDWCVVGEPSSVERLGDTVKNGRRGSLTGRIQVRGLQGHVAYPRQAENALHRLLPVLTELVATSWDDGDADFPPTSLQVSNIRAGTGADNVIPGAAEATFNLRYSPALQVDDIRERVERVCREHGLDYRIDWHHSGAPFITRYGRLPDAVLDAVESATGSRPALSTAGGTSDGRFVAPTGAEVVEVGPVNATIHKIDEHVDVADLDRLSGIYKRIMQILLG